MFRLVRSIEQEHLRTAGDTSGVYMCGMFAISDETLLCADSANNSVKVVELRSTHADRLDTELGDGWRVMGVFQLGHSGDALLLLAESKETGKDTRVRICKRDTANTRRWNTLHTVTLPEKSSYGVCMRGKQF